MGPGGAVSVTRLRSFARDLTRAWPHLLRVPTRAVTLPNLACLLLPMHGARGITITYTGSLIDLPSPILTTLTLQRQWSFSCCWLKPTVILGNPGNLGLCIGKVLLFQKSWYFYLIYN